nr:hypothetical protein [Bacteroidota bacterium]
MNDNTQNRSSETIQSEMNCKGCGSTLTYAPGTTVLKCLHCSTENEIEISTEEIEELDFEKFLSQNDTQTEQVEVQTVKCNGCGAETTFDPNLVSDDCAFCGTPLVIKSGSTKKIIRPKSVLPFAIDSQKAFNLFRAWLKKLWWAPDKLKKFALHHEQLKGMYIPYWTYDSKTQSAYTGQRGDHYYESQSYTENGERKTRQVQKTRWHHVSGRVSKVFDDVLVLASNSLPKEKTDKLEPWDLHNLVPFDEKFLSGYKAESYQVDLKQGFGEAKVKMDTEIRNSIRHDIGGDEQRIGSVNTKHDDITFKHLLLPIWISAYKFKGKVFQFVVNGRTGEVQGERPYSWIKIALAVLAGIIVIGTVYFLVRMYG